MKNSKPFLNGTILTLAALLPIVAAGGVLIPTSYSYTAGTTAGEPGFFFYDDPTLTRLTDGSAGTVNIQDGSWVGWQTNGADQITFTFASSVTITNVSLDFLRSDNANTQVPTSVTIDGTDFPTADFASTDTKGFINYAGSFSGSSLIVTLNHPTSNWAFVNEAQFTGTVSSGSVPEPASLALVGMALGSLILGRKLSLGRS